ncbi:MAG: sigma-70 family RNA polymerase sigma factor [Thermoanaerobaculia bacterium]
MIESLIEQLQAPSSRDDANDAFRRLFDLYSPRLYHFFNRRGFSHSDSLDLTQETFLGIYKGIGAFRRDSSFETWLFKIATNAYRQRLRRGVAGKRDAPEIPLEGSAEEGGPMAALATDEPVPGEEMLQRERSLLLRQAIDRLPEQMRKCLVLRVDHEMAYKEIAVVLRVSPETVKVHLARARRRLQEELGPYFEGLVTRFEEGA